MSNQNIQILELAKQGLTAPEIAEALGYAIADVEYVLKFDPEMTRALAKAEVQIENQKELTDAELDQLRPFALKTLKELIIGAEKDSVRLTASTYVLDHQLGLKEPKEAPVVNNIVVFNDRLAQARERRKMIDDRAINIETAQVA